MMTQKILTATIAFMVAGGGDLHLAHKQAKLKILQTA